MSWKIMCKLKSAYGLRVEGRNKKVIRRVCSLADASSAAG